MPITDFGFSPFSHPEFVRHGVGLPGQGDLRSVQHGEDCLIYEELRPAFLLGAGMARVWAHDYAPLAGFRYGLIQPGDPSHWSYEKMASLLDQLADQVSAGLLFWPFFPNVAPFSDWVEQWARERDYGPILTLREHERAICWMDRDEDGSISQPDGGEQGLVLRAKKKKEYARQLRRLGEGGKLDFKSATNGVDFSDALEAFFQLEALGWKGERGTALICDPRTAEFARACLPAMAKDGQAQIDWLSLDDKMVAGLISLRAGSGLFTWKIASDPAYAKFSVGVQIMLHVSRSALQDLSICYLDSLATANHPMVDHLWAGRRSIASLLIPLSTSGRRSAKLAKHYYQGRDKLRQQAKALLKR